MFIGPAGDVDVRFFPFLDIVKFCECDFPSGPFCDGVTVTVLPDCDQVPN